MGQYHRYNVLHHPQGQDLYTSKHDMEDIFSHMDVPDPGPPMAVGTLATDLSTAGDAPKIKKLPRKCEAEIVSLTSMCEIVEDLLSTTDEHISKLTQSDSGKEEEETEVA